MYIINIAACRNLALLGVLCQISYRTICSINVISIIISIGNTRSCN
nr:MAG TPA: hypothetical protein [Bacteriophage sp.]